ncbi:MAG: hypothetical protein ACXWLH_00370 [Candidatus Saccharimonadales bacterium]
MRKRLIKRMQGMLPNKVLRRQQFSKRIKDRKRHDNRYNLFSYRHSTKASRFNRWQDYRRMINRSY